MSAIWNEMIHHYRIHSSIHERWNTWLHAFSFYSSIIPVSYNKIRRLHKRIQTHRTCIIDRHTLHWHYLYSNLPLLEKRHSFQSAYSSCEENQRWSLLKIWLLPLIPIYHLPNKQNFNGSCRVRLNRMQASTPYTMIRIISPSAIAERIPMWVGVQEGTQYNQNHYCHHLWMQQEEKKRRKCSKWERTMEPIPMG